MIGNRIYLLILCTLCLVIFSCDSKNPVRSEPLMITITADQHHLGDNTGSEGFEYAESFSISNGFNIATLQITFLYPNDAGQSGPEIDSPPEIQINDTVIGLAAGDFPDSAECISQYREYECDVTIFKQVTSYLVLGTNTIKVIAKGAAHDGDDDFVFTDLKIELVSAND